ncbi:hypothetical protein [Pseudobutyrivibrio sp.]|uniref:hypothetical protein n=1 Tax=Pseudobutyrivibrio sp. TaxID=2014367 RepID=UPI0025E3B86F|nr:hypothetical protein [Pseudobutyrivibrio sp.]MBR5650289.1 hypothetical protein [Pseudobutyrivibrio sp.]
MAVQFERNINLEDIDSDALFGIEYLAHQTVGQKIILWGNVIIAVFGFVFLQLVYDAPVLITFPVLFVFLSIGFLFGANQSENLSIAGYLKLLFFKPKKYLNFSSTEDISLMKEEAVKLKNEAEIQKKREVSATPEGQRRSLIVVIVLIVTFIVFAMVMFGLKTYKVNNSVHHTVGALVQQQSLF